MRRTTVAGVPLAVLAATLLGGCLGRSPSSNRSGEVAVSMRKLRFSPKTVTVRVGQRVRWTNDDGVDHNVTATRGASFRSSAFGQGGTYAFTPTKPGRISYVCTLHPGMSGVIVVRR